MPSFVAITSFVIVLQLQIITDIKLVFISTDMVTI